MIDKLKELIGSRRFWILTAGLVSFLLGQWSAGTLDADVVFNALTTYFAAIVGIGTLDKVANIK